MLTKKGCIDILFQRGMDTKKRDQAPLWTTQTITNSFFKYLRLDGPQRKFLLKKGGTRKTPKRGGIKNRGVIRPLSELWYVLGTSTIIWLLRFAWSEKVVVCKTWYVHSNHCHLFGNKFSTRSKLVNYQNNLVQALQMFWIPKLPGDVAPLTLIRWFKAPPGSHI